MNKSILLSLSLFASFMATASAQYQTAVSAGLSNVSIPIPAGQVMHVLSFTYENSGSGYGGTLSITKNSVTSAVRDCTNYNSNISGNARDETFLVGPATVTMTGTAATAKLVLTYKLFDNSTVAGSSTPSNSVVIPADSSGPVNVILESNTDLVTWTAASPGAYGSSTAKRFFRVRTIANQ